MPESCEFCWEIRTGLVPESYVTASVPRERTLWAWTGGRVIASLSPISAGHVLILPTAHVSSTFQLSATEFSEISSQIDSVTDALINRSESVLVFEHGVGEGETGGCGVEHAHVHALPVDESVALAALTRFEGEVGANAGKWESLMARDSYAFLEVRTRSWHKTALGVGEFRSQYLRNLVEVASGVVPSDWRELVRATVIQDTLAVLAD